ncbi:MAG TPA: glycoside hydrolase family 5 protein [Polyangiaceae bacterium]
MFSAACVTGARSSSVSAGAAAAAPGAKRAAPIHQVSEIEAPPADVQSQPVPGFMRGINLGNALDAPKEGAWGVVLEPAHFAMAKAAGLDHVRLPVRFSAHAALEAPFTVEPVFFARVDWAIAQAKEQGLSVIVDLHHYEELMKQPNENADRLVGIWKQIAERYKDQPTSVAFELINEPCDQLKPELLNPITQRALATVRASNPTRTVFVDSFSWADAEQLQNLELPEDANLVPSFHDYQPILFTHQGLEWMPPEFQTRPVVFPGPPAVPVTPVPAARNTSWVSGWFYSYNQAKISDNSGGPSAIFGYFKIVDAYVKRTKRRVYMGEFGVSDNADPESRESWLRLVRQEAEKRQIGWALWDDGGRFRARDVKRGTWVAPISAALFD